MAQRIVSQLIRPRPETTVFYLCDVQERFRALIHKFPSVVAASSILLRGAGIFGCPVVVTEQHPKAFLRTGPCVCGACEQLARARCVCLN